MDSSCKRPRIRMNGIDQASAAPASRIFRVPRDAGGKDRHSKVITARGVRDRRVRLSVPTAIQFYDLQDRLGFDQPSKAVEWLIQAAASAIAQLPSLQSTFTNSNPELTHSLHAHKVFDAGPMKSASYSSTSETSKDSIDEDDGGRGPNPTNTQNSFSELLTGSGPAHLQHLSFLEHHAAGGDCSLNFSIVSPGDAHSQGLNRGTLQSNSLSHLSHRRQQHLLPMFASAVEEGPSMPFFFSPAAAPAGGGGSADCLLPGGFDGRLQLCSGEGSWHYSDPKGKGRG